MSRTLDGDTKKALQNADHRVVFEAISAVLSQERDAPLEIELLGAVHTSSLTAGEYYVQEAKAIAIPKIGLASAFIEARRLLLELLQSGIAPANEDKLMSVTAVILLMDPEHLTAANTRKRIIRNRDLEEELITQELHLIDSYLTSRLHRHTKSPTLWNHRRWLVESRKANCIDLELTFRSVILVAAERHPRNYYAWCHARDLVQRADLGRHCPRELRTIVRNWCLAHHDDISGWTFLLWLSDLALTSGTESERLDSQLDFEQTIKRAEAFRWRNDSVWFFLLNLARRNPSWSEELRRLQALSSRDEELRHGAIRHSLRYFDA